MRPSDSTFFDIGVGTEVRIVCVPVFALCRFKLIEPVMSVAQKVADRRTGAIARTLSKVSCAH